MWIYFILATLSCKQVFAQATDDEYVKIQFCKNDKSISVQIPSEVTDSGLNCTCQTNLPIQQLEKENYVLTPGIGLHKLHTTPKNWNDARKLCMKEGAHLAIINSIAEEEVLINLLKNSSTSIKGATNTAQALIGIHDQFKEDEWVTIFGDSIYTTGYSNWSPTYFGGQPDNYMGNQNCGAIIDEGGIDDVFCQSRFAFVCEMPLMC